MALSNKSHTLHDIFYVDIDNWIWILFSGILKKIFYYFEAPYLMTTLSIIISEAMEFLCIILRLFGKLCYEIVEEILLIINECKQYKKVKSCSPLLCED